MEEDARKLSAEAEDLERATGRTHILAAAKSDVLQHVGAVVAFVAVRAFPCALHCVPNKP